MKFRISWLWWVAVVLTFFVVGGVVVWVTGPTQKVSQESLFIDNGSFVGYINAIRSTGGQHFLSIDAIEFLSGEEAFAAIQTDLGCDRKRAAECVPSMNNDFYIRNLTQESKEYSVAPAAVIRYQPNPGSPELKTATSFTEFLTAYRNTDTFMWQLPFRIDVASGSVRQLVQQYVP